MWLRIDIPGLRLKGTQRTQRHLPRQPTGSLPAARLSGSSWGMDGLWTPSGTIVPETTRLDLIFSSDGPRPKPRENEIESREVSAGSWTGAVQSAAEGR